MHPRARGVGDICRADAEAEAGGARHQEGHDGEDGPAEGPQLLDLCLFCIGGVSLLEVGGFPFNGRCPVSLIQESPHHTTKNETYLGHHGGDLSLQGRVRRAFGGQRLLGLATGELYTCVYRRKG